MKQHLKRLASPKTWPIKRKENVWIARSNPGSHSLDNSIPILILLRDVLKIAKNKKEVKYILNNKLIKVNNRAVKDVRFPVGLFDIIFIEKENKIYRLVFNKKRKLIPIEIDKKESNLLLLKIRDKRLIKKGIIQLNFTNGWSLNVTKKDYSPKDSVVLDLNSNKIVDHLPLKEGNLAFITGGKHVGSVVNIKEVKDKIILESDKKTWTGVPEYIFVIGKKTPIIKLNQK